MKKIIAMVVLAVLTISIIPQKSFAAGGIYASGGGTKTVGQSFTITVSASGAAFNALEGTISISGPVSVSSFSAGNATWITAPSNGVHFVGMVTGGTDSLRVATIKLKATGVGSGSVSVGAVKLANGGSVTGTGTGSADFSIAKAPDLPGAPTVTSSTHPDPAQSYDGTTVSLSWDKAAGVDNFSYLLDQAADTTPPAKTTDANTSVSYPDKAVDTYYFHIRAHKADGWGGTTHFKINIKVPDPKIDTTLSQPSNIKIEKSDKFTNDITLGTVTGIIISGKVLDGFKANATLTPTLTLPEGKSLTATADTEGNFSILIDYPIATGHYTLTIQGQKDLVLTPVSDKIIFEISQKKGGAINILTNDDINPPVKTIEQAKKWYQKITLTRNIAYYIGIGLIGLIAIIVIILAVIKKKKTAKILKSIRK